MRRQRKGLDRLVRRGLRSFEVRGFIRTVNRRQQRFQMLAKFGDPIRFRGAGNEYWGCRRKSRCQPLLRAYQVSIQFRIQETL
jgi:hypothetical protein